MKYKWNYKYAQSTQPLFGESPSLICQEYKNLPAIDLSPSLFIGDGEGRNSRFIANSNIDVTAIDFSEVATKKALEVDKKLGLIWFWNLVDLLVLLIMKLLRNQNITN